MEIVRILDSARGKDQVIRLSTYVFMLLGGGGNTPIQAKFRKLAAEMSGCRVILRLFDDMVMLRANLASGFGFKEPNPILRPLQVVSGLLGQLYYPVEHVAWLRSNSVLSGDAGPLSLAGLVIWVLMLVTEILKSIVKLRVNGFKMHQLKKQKRLENLEDKELHSPQKQEIEDNFKKLIAERRDLFLAIVQSGADLTNAISWLPKGFLWSQKLSPAVNGLCGTIATVMMLIRNWPK